MHSDFSRSERLGEQIHRELSGLIQRELKDPRVGMVTIGEVEVSSDLSYAKVYYTILGDPDSHEETQQGLDRASGFLRSQLGKRLRTRLTPGLKFIFDDSEQRGARIDAAIAAARLQDDLARSDDQ